MEFSNEKRRLAEDAEKLATPAFAEFDRTAEENQWRVIRAFQKHKVSDYHFSASTGYAYNDRGREVLDLVYADVFGAEAALVRPHFASGTHTIGTALQGVLRPGDHLLFLTGSPYDTLHKVIGETGDGTGSLRDFGIRCDTVALREDGSVDFDEAGKLICKDTRMVYIQRSRGYVWRPSFTVEEIRRMADFVRSVKKDAVVFVDNCYGEFAETLEPTMVGADLIAGSLIKNPGGGLAPSGGYIAGREALVRLASYRTTVPGLGAEVGAMLETKRALFQGLFLAPHFVGQALKGSVFAGAVFERLGFETSPAWSAPRTDLIQAVRFEREEQLIAFVQAIQRASAVDAHVVPEPWEMPGYEHPVIMAAGSFIQGGSLELSADAPLRAPYTAYMQGGLTYAQIKYAVLAAVEQLESHGYL